MTHIGEINEYDCANCSKYRIIHCTGGYYDTGRRWHCNSWDKIKREQAEKLLASIKAEGEQEE